MKKEKEKEKCKKIYKRRERKKGKKGKKKKIILKKGTAQSHSTSIFFIFSAVVKIYLKIVSLIGHV